MKKFYNPGPVVIKTYVLSIFEWLFYTGFTVLCMIGALARLHGCTGLSESRLLTDVMPKSHVFAQLYFWFAFLFCMNSNVTDCLWPRK